MVAVVVKERSFHPTITLISYVSSNEYCCYPQSSASRFDIHVDGELAGFADYKLKDGVIVFPHTEIDPKFGGKGLGTTLIEFALNEIAQENLSVEPLCPFVSKYIGKHPELLYLVEPSKRSKFGLS
ncbi:MAG: N-acetyltransferase [Actinobacteria bacterium]|nr:N-acetyltransferase [Actinomycetota bacterium]